MELLSTQTLHLLAEPVKAPCVSIFLPVERGSYDQRAARLELKNLIATARASVRGTLKPEETDALLAPAESLLAHGVQWSDLHHGIAFFLAPEKSLVVHLPSTVEPVVMIGDHFDVLPLLPLLQPDIEFHVLAVSRNDVKLYRGSRHMFEKMQVAGLPDNIDDDLWYEERSNALVSHGGPRLGNSGQPTSVVHGGESWRDERKDMFERFAQHLDNALEPAIFGTGAPLVLAAVEREAAFFRGVSRHPHLLEAGLIGNPDEASPTELHSRAWRLVLDEVAARHQAEVLSRFAGLAHTGRSSVDATVIYDAAGTGRIDTLLIPERDIRVSDVGPRLAGGVDNFVNDVVLQTLVHGGKVEVVPPISLAEGVTAAAIFRWPQTEAEI